MSVQHSQSIIGDYIERMPRDIENLQNRMVELITQTISESPGLPANTSGGNSWYACLALEKQVAPSCVGSSSVKEAVRVLFSSYD